MPPSSDLICTTQKPHTLSTRECTGLLLGGSFVGGGCVVSWAWVRCGGSLLKRASGGYGPDLFSLNSTHANTGGTSLTSAI
eukprot:m.302115 g.302115  ORF g.302115 m.302115 type:complete len:81 (+) comp27288_c0_seq1:5543-5785(+)